MLGEMSAAIRGAVTDFIASQDSSEDSAVEDQNIRKPRRSSVLGAKRYLQLYRPSLESSKSDEKGIKAILRHVGLKTDDEIL